MSRTADSDETDRRRAEQDFGDLLYTTRDAEHFEHLLRESQRLANSAGLRLLAVQPEASSVTRQFRRYPMRLTVDGAPDGLTRLLLGLTDLRPRVDVEQVALHTGEDPAHVSAEVVVSSLAWAPK